MAVTGSEIALQNFSKYQIPTGDVAIQPEQAGAKTSLAQNYSTFLKMLTTQLQNQDPLAPMDSTQFTQQLVQYSAVEQQIAANDKLDKLINLGQNNGLGSTLGYIGKEVEMTGDQITLSGGSAGFKYALSDSSSATVIQILDDNGVAKRTLSGKLQAGTHSLTWDGKDDDGNSLPDGNYSVVVAATKADNTKVNVTTTTYGLVTGAETTDSGNVLLVGDKKLDLSSILSIRMPKAAAGS